MERVKVLLLGGLVLTQDEDPRMKMLSPSE